MPSYRMSHLLLLLLLGFVAGSCSSRLLSWRKLLLLSSSKLLPVSPLGLYLLRR